MGQRFKNKAMHDAYMMCIKSSQDKVKESLKRPGSTFDHAFKCGYKGLPRPSNKDRIRYAFYIAGKEYNNRLKWDIYGNEYPVQIETEEWWFNGRIIQKNDNPMLSRYVSWSDDENSRFVETHNTKREAVLFAIQNPCTNPTNFPKDYL